MNTAVRRLSAVSLLPLLLAHILAGQYVGHQACQGCHLSQFNEQSQTGHAHALASSPKGRVGQWAFGAGAKAITYVSQLNEDTYVEHGQSFYTERKSLGITPGHVNRDDRLYRTFDPVATALRCFRCHSTGPLQLGTGKGIEPSETGVHCESCHGPGESHLKQSGSKGIFNPKQLSAAELNEFCGTCHRKAGDVSDWSNSWNVRHEPAYLSQAACFRKSAGALSCLTCHNPHAPLGRDFAEYDKRCVSCHSGVRHRTVKTARACVECHMPQVPTSAELKFTNHWIGIYAKDNPLVPIRGPGKILPPVVVASLQGKVMPAADPSSFRPLFEQVLADKERDFGPNHPSVARSASDLGLFLNSIGEQEAALSPLRKALDVDRSNANPAVPADQENLASIFAALGRHEEEFQLLRLASEGRDPAVAARSLARLAALDPGNAETWYRQAVQSAEAAYGKEHSRVALLLNNLALALRQKNDNASAEPLLRRALAIQQKSLGPNHPAVAATLNNLGSLLQSAGKFEEAERLERTALRIFERKLGPETAELATTCTNLADLLWTKGARTEAVQLYRRALSTDESIYGSDHPEVAADLGNLALLLKDLGQTAAAERLFSRALAIYEKHYGPDSPQAIEMRRNLKH